MYKEMFASRLKEARKKTGFTQKEVEAETGIAQNNITRYETGIREPDIETLGILANFYGVSTDWLYGLGMQARNKPSYEITNEYDGKKRKHTQKVGLT